MPARTSRIEIDDLTVAYDRRPAVHHLNGRFEAGSLTAVVGPNGAGDHQALSDAHAEGRSDHAASPLRWR